MVIAGEDEVNPPDHGRELFAALGTPVKKLHVEQTAGHYDMYEGQHFESSIDAQIHWFREHL
jgi:poly-beta-hydroxyalkanoate depolymerase